MSNTYHFIKQHKTELLNKDWDTTCTRGPCAQKCNDNGKQKDVSFSCNDNATSDKHKQEFDTLGLRLVHRVRGTHQGSYRNKLSMHSKKVRLQTKVKKWEEKQENKKNQATNKFTKSSTERIGLIQSRPRQRRWRWKAEERRRPSCR
jgi:hypothetical protein